MGVYININVDVIWETFVGFLKSVVLQLLPKYSQSYANLNVKSRPKFNSLSKQTGFFSVFHLNVTCKTL